MIVDLLADHTFRTVVLGTAVIGLTSGALGVVAYLRKQSLISDVVAHAALPGTLLAFLVAVTLGLDGRNMTALVVGATVVGTLAVWCTNAIARVSRVRLDAAMAVVLTTFFGAGMLLLRHIGDRPYPGKGGVHDYLFGNAATLTVADVTTSAVVGVLALAVTGLFGKELTHRAFDASHAAVAGFSPRVVDGVAFAAIAVATVVGVKAVGLVLMVAFVVTPAAAARQWTRSARSMTLLAGCFGASGSGLGAYLSIAYGPVPTGPVVVLVLFAIFVASLLAAPRRGLVALAVARSRARRRMRATLVGAGA